MRRIYITLALLGMLVTSVFAQRHCDVEILPLIGPVNGSNYSCNSKVVSGYYFINHGPDIILSTDSFQLSDPNIDNANLGADPLDFSSFYYYKGFPTGLQLNGAIGDSIPAPTMNIAPGDTLIYYKWDDTVTRLSTLIKADTYAISIDGDTMDYYVFTPNGEVPPNGNYYWLARFSGFYGSDVVDTNSANNYAYSAITLNCQTSGISGADLNKINFTVYPNPANDRVTFNYSFERPGMATAVIKDLTGHSLLIKDFGKSAAGEHEYSIDVSHLAPGIYLLEFWVDDRQGSSKIVIRK